MTNICIGCSKYNGICQYGENTKASSCSNFSNPIPIKTILHNTKKLKLLVACEKSHKVAKAFNDIGFEAWSSDILPCEIKDAKHIQDDVLKHLNDGWDMMIAHPPCTYLSYAAMGIWNKPGRKELREKAMNFFMQFVNAPIKYICIENPLGYASEAYRKPDQTIHPFYFGEPHLKRTCLWLKNLPPLYWSIKDNLLGKATGIPHPEPLRISPTGKKEYFTEFNAFDPETRSRTFESIAQAMATQWGTKLLIGKR